MPKTFTLMGAHCLSQCNDETHCQIAVQSMTLHQTAFLSTVQMQLKIPATLTTMFLKRTENGCSCALKVLKLSIYKVNAKWRNLERLWKGRDNKNRSTRRIKTTCLTYSFSSTNPIRTCLELSPDLRDQMPWFCKFFCIPSPELLFIFRKFWKATFLCSSSNSDFIGLYKVV